ncbi:MAG TPA: hypothetical protein VFK94_01060, partial [Patescibacteria group bacterium]|nr:hypothetical protein [Patescibacteria group bacterium]
AGTVVAWGSQLEAGSTANVYAKTTGTNIGTLARGVIASSTTGNSLFYGNLGIGTTAPAAQLDISKYTSTLQGGPVLRLTRDYTGTDYGTAIYNGWNGAAQDTLVFGVSSGSGSGGPEAAGNEKMVIQSNGNVGIGTTGPASTLHVASAIANHLSQFVYTGTTNGAAAVYASTQGSGGTSITNYGVYGSATAIGTTSVNIGGYFTASGNTNNYALITGSGNVGIGTSAPGHQLQIGTNFNGSITNGKFFVNGGGTQNDYTGKIAISPDGNAAVAGVISQYFDSTNNIEKLSLGTIGYSGVEQTMVLQNGNVGIGDTSPSTRLSLGGTGSANGITFGDDGVDPVNLYRSAANTLKTDDDLVIGSTGNGKITVGVVDPYLITNTGTFQSYLEFRTTATAGADDFVFTLGGVEKGRITEGGNLTVTGLVTAQGTGTNTFSGTVDMQSNLILNIGNAGTDFTTGGGLNLAGSLSVGAPTNGNAGIELGYTGGVATTPFIDLHSGATSVDYDARIIASGGTGATGNGLLSLNSSGVDVSGSYVEIGTTPATAGVLRLPNNTGINFRNAANTADIQALAIDASNNLALTTTAALNLSAGAASTFTLANVANALNFDSNTLSIDALNNRVGIGTNAPSKSLEVGGTGVSVTGGRVAIDGTDTAILAGEIALLENGGTLITSSRGSVQFALDNDNNETTASFT